MRSRAFPLYLVLLLGGAALVLWGSSTAWITWDQKDSVSLVSVRRHVDGHTLQHGMRAAALLALAGVPALLVLRRPMLRRAFAAGLGLLPGGAVLAAAAQAAGERRSPTIRLLVGESGCDNATTGICFGEYARPQLGPVLVVLGALLLLAAGVAAIAWGQYWRARLGSSYEAPGGRAPEPVTDKGVWDALDKGHDPTA